MTVLQESQTITVRPVAGHIGADISGIDIAAPLAPETAQQLKDALHEYKVIFFRDQHLDHASQIVFGRQFGTLTYAHPHDEAPRKGTPRSSPSTRGGTSSGTARTSASWCGAGSTATSPAGTPTSPPR